MDDKPLTTSNFGKIFADTVHETLIPALDNITEKIEVLQTDMKDVKKRLGNVEDGLKEVKEDMATKDDLKKLEDTLTTRMDRMGDVQSDLTERVEELESPTVFA